MRHKGLKNNNTTTITQATITSVSIFIGICLGVLLLNIKFDFPRVGFNASSLTIGGLILALCLFLTANQFFLLALGHPKHGRYFEAWGVGCYGLGEVLLVLSICLFLRAKRLNLFSYLFLTVYLIAEIIYYVVRGMKLEKEPYSLTRSLIRVIMFAILGGGYFLVYLLQE